jgi:uncharacterized membrane protein
MDDQVVILILRLLHITFGVFWVGSILNFALFIVPAVKASGSEGTKFMQQFGKTSYPIMIALSGVITIITGVLLIWKLSNGFESAWFQSSYAKVLTTGSVLAFIAFIIGFTVNRPVAMRLDKVGDAIARSGGVPTPEQLNELTALRKRIFTATNYIAILLTLTVISMAICRYVGVL